MSSFKYQAVQPEVSATGATGATGAGTATTAPAAPPGAGALPPQSMITLLFFVLVLVPFLFMSFRRQKKEATARAALKKGDRVVTQSGLIGELVELEERISKVKVAPGTTVQVLTSSVAPFDSGAAQDDKQSKDLADLRAAKTATADKK